MLPVETDIKHAYSVGQDGEQRFISNLAQFLSTFMKEKSSLIEYYLPSADRVVSLNDKTPSDFVKKHCSEIMQAHDLVGF